MVLYFIALVVGLATVLTGMIMLAVWLITIL